mmetsp:Transcript_71575/g.158276  ORF Transcript_71575/g.158276 Transcript_71575/m.158276 type:complete len:523 (-) Transcript_71575:106-1674(-)
MGHSFVSALGSTPVTSLWPGEAPKLPESEGKLREILTWKGLALGFAAALGFCFFSKISFLGFASSVGFPAGFSEGFSASSSAGAATASSAGAASASSSSASAEAGVFTGAGSGTFAARVDSGAFVGVGSGAFAGAGSGAFAGSDSGSFAGIGSGTGAGVGFVASGGGADCAFSTSLPFDFSTSLLFLTGKDATSCFFSSSSSSSSEYSQLWTKPDSCLFTFLFVCAFTWAPGPTCTFPPSCVVWGSSSDSPSDSGRSAALTKPVPFRTCVGTLVFFGSGASATLLWKRTLAVPPSSSSSSSSSSSGSSAALTKPVPFLQGFAGGPLSASLASIWTFLFTPSSSSSSSSSLSSLSEAAAPPPISSSLSSRGGTAGMNRRTPLPRPPPRPRPWRRGRELPALSSSSSLGSMSGARGGVRCKRLRRVASAAALLRRIAASSAAKASSHSCCCKRKASSSEISSGAAWPPRTTPRLTPRPQRRAKASRTSQPVSSRRPMAGSRSRSALPCVATMWRSSARRPSLSA